MPKNKMPSPFSLEEGPMNEALMQVELVNLQANYKHLSVFYKAYKEDNERHMFKQNQKICELLGERRLLERIMGSFNRSDKVARERNRKALTDMFASIKRYHEEMMIELGRLQKDNHQIEELEDSLFDQRKAMGGITGPLEHRLALYRRRRRLENTNHKITVMLNDTMADNKKLRDEINHIRIERAAFNRLYKKVSTDLDICKRRKSDILMNTSQALDHRQEAITKIRVQKDREEKDTIVYEQSVRVLDRMMSHETKVNSSLTVKCNDRHEFKQEEAAVQEKHKQETLSADIKTMNENKESFDCIREVTELDKPETIVGQFLSREAENFSLFNYVTNLNGQNEILEDDVNKLEKAIEKLRKEKEAAIEHNTHDLALIEEERDLLVVALSKSEGQLTALNAVLEPLKGLIFETFNRIGCSTKSLENVLGLNTEISFKNMTEYLVQIEHRANELLNILHYVNLKKSQITGLRAARIDLTQFVPKSLPTFNVLMPSMTDDEEDDGEHDEIVEVLHHDQLAESAQHSVAERTRATLERLAREASH